MMTKFLLATGLLAFSLVSAERKITLFTAIDIGRLENGYDVQKGYDPSGLILNRTYADIGVADQLDPHFLLSLGVGGIFWKAMETGGGTPQDKVIKFGPGISRAMMAWTPSPKLSLTLGYFPYKYNAMAHNLGEYLFRTEAYPTIVYNGGWSWMNDAHYRTVGAKLTAQTGDLKHDFCLFSEYFNAPIYDITPAYVGTWAPSKAFTFGGGVSLHRYLSASPQVKKALNRTYRYHENFYFPEVPYKTRYNVDIPDYIGEATHDVSWFAGKSANVDSLRSSIWASDSSTLSGIYGVASASLIPLKQDTSALVNIKGRPGEVATRLRDDIILQYQEEQRDSAAYFGDPRNAGNVAKEVSFDLAAVKLLAFFSLDFNALLGMDASGIGDFGVYGEVAQLGLKNYPIFYTRYEERMPIMLGASVPTFGLLKNLSVEIEYLKNPTVESIASTYDKLDLPPDPEFRYQEFKRDDIKWSVHATRRFTDFLSLYVQVANDHMRLKDGAARPEYIPVTNEPGHWYWLTRIQWTI